MTTMSLADVESIVGEMPALVCEFPDRPCDAQSEWVARIHLTDHWERTCQMVTITLCDPHVHEAEAIVITDERGTCRLCGTEILSVFHKERL
ncbi:hypothetical protein BKG71_19295 [Mycobacteroides chelonae]|nr:hypothetical protein BKG71_19295 [Mycobacteroides chelonae]